MSPEQLAARFARCLDAEDYGGAAACLADGCRYDAGDATHTGPAAIVAAYRAHGDWAARHLDEVTYESEVHARDDGEIRVRFTDHVRHAGVAHTYRCEQVLSFDDAGLIRAIRHVDLPGEASALQAFYVRAGLADAGTRAEPEV